MVADASKGIDQMMEGLLILFITGLAAPEFLAFLGNRLFVANFNSGTVGEYDANTGTPREEALLSWNGKGYRRRSGACCERRAGDGRQRPADGIDLVA